MFNKKILKKVTISIILLSLLLVTFFIFWQPKRLFSKTPSIENLVSSNEEINLSTKLYERHLFYQNEKLLHERAEKEVSPLIELFLKKYDELKEKKNKLVFSFSQGSGLGNNIIGLSNLLIFSIFSDSFVSLNRETGGVLKGFVVRNKKLNKAMWEYDSIAPTSYYTIKKRQKQKTLGRYKKCAGNVCSFLASGDELYVTYFELLEMLDFQGTFEKNGKRRDNHGFMKKDNLALELNLKVNSPYHIWLMSNKRKMDVLCDEYELCRGLSYENFLNKYPAIKNSLSKSGEDVRFLDHHFDYDLVMGNVFNELFRLKPEFDDVIKEIIMKNVRGYLVGLHIRRDKCRNLNKVSFPVFEETLECYKDNIFPEVLDKLPENEEITVFIAGGIVLPNNLKENFKKFSKNRKIKILTGYDFFNVSSKYYEELKKDNVLSWNYILRKHNDDLDLIFSIILDFMFLRLSDLILYPCSSFSRIAYATGVMEKKIVYHSFSRFCHKKIGIEVNKICDSEIGIHNSKYNCA